MSRVWIALFAVSIGIALLVAPVFIYYTAAQLLEAVGAEPVTPLAVTIVVIAEVAYVFGAGVWLTTIGTRRS